MAVTAAKSVMAFRVLTMAVDLCRLTTRTMNVNAGHERTSKARIIHQIQLIRGITPFRLSLLSYCLSICSALQAVRLCPGETPDNNVSNAGNNPPQQEQSIQSSTRR
ncbi:glutamate decarboxylase isozyme [Shigella dysenteriae 1617]|uniref:Uncharacterized protein n=1 Tax=Shigella dysenteriae serotype 1 (strain Sd197) TaxID=300267 RepID=Q32BU7_SHIDS|nr:hypothetical protein SDY_3198 [Shigella dysenteriae Sd197]EFP71908.1 glutamate decarboxylase isozyme [Shigella dysenteriae 1617]